MEPASMGFSVQYAEVLLKKQSVTFATHFQYQVQFPLRYRSTGFSLITIMLSCA